MIYCERNAPQKNTIYILHPQENINIVARTGKYETSLFMSQFILAALVFNEFHSTPHPQIIFSMSLCYSKAYAFSLKRVHVCPCKNTDADYCTRLIYKSPLTAVNWFRALFWPVYYLLDTGWGSMET